MVRTSKTAQPQMRALPRATKIPKKAPKWWLISLIAVIVAVAVVIGVTLAFGGKKDDKSASSSNQYADTVTIGLKLGPHNLDIRNTAGSALRPDPDRQRIRRHRGT